MDSGGQGGSGTCLIFTVRKRQVWGSQVTTIPCSKGQGQLHFEDKSPAALHRTSVHLGYSASTKLTALLSTSVCVPKSPALLPLSSLRLPWEKRCMPDCCPQLLTPPSISYLKITTASETMGSQHWAVMTLLRNFFLKEFRASVKWVRKIMASYFTNTFSRFHTMARKWRQMQQ